MEQKIINKLKDNRGDVLGGSLGKVAAIFLALILMFIFPLMEISQRNDDSAQTAVQAATVKFVDNVAATEKLTEGMYDTFVTTINATGNKYEIVMEHKILDVNNAPGKKGVSTTKIGENTYYSTFTRDILEYFETHPGNTYNLNPGDMFNIEVYNTNKTISSMFLSMFGGQETASKINVEYGSIIK